MSKLWSKRSTIIKNLHKKYKVNTCKKKIYKTTTDLDTNLDIKIQDANSIHKTSIDSKTDTNTIINIDTDLDVNLVYEIIENPDTHTKDEIYGFINENYIFLNQTIHIHSNELLDVLLKNSVCILFTDKKRHDTGYKIAGLAFFQKDYFCLKGDFEITKRTPYINVKLLCLHSIFYNRYNLKFMVKCIREVYNMKNNESIDCLIYKLRRPMVSFFSKKSYYSRPINIDRIISNKNRGFSLNMAVNANNLQLIKKLYNTFSYPTHFPKTFYLDFFLDLQDKNTDEKMLFVDTIFNLLQEYKSNTYTIYNSDSKTDVEEMLTNRNFYKFVIRDNNNVINNFICLYCYDIYNFYNDTTCKNAIVYSIVLENLSLEYLSYIIEFVSEYCYNNNLCDMISLENFVDIFDCKVYKLTKFYYDCFYHCEKFNKINPCKNGLPAL